MKRASYREAIRWIVLNDDTTGLAEDEGCPALISEVLVADIFNVHDSKVRADVLRQMVRRGDLP